MPPSKPKSQSTSCSHKQLQLEPSAYAAEAGFTWLPAADRVAATTKSGRKASRIRGGGEPSISAGQIAADSQLATFPGPLVLPWDELGWDPEPDLQSFRSWHQEKVRNKPTGVRQTLYVLEVPESTEEVAVMRQWIRPSGDDATPLLESPATQDVVDYLAAFYHGFPTKLLPERLRFVPWGKRSGAPKKQKQPSQQYVGLATADGKTTRIRARPTPDGVFAMQLNLDDILDAAMALLPEDAYAIVLLIDHDLYEDEDDDFCCGRAYGGSRVCVVSSARYRPGLEDLGKVDLEHMWPTSHCKSYAAGLCAEQDIHKATRDVPTRAGSPMRAAVDAASQMKHSTAPEYLRGLWFSRLVRTVSHELGHCLCLAHCAYYACLMQSTAGMAEDYRMPPYLCPVCLGKISYAAAVELRQGDEEARALFVRERYAALETFCDRWKHVGLFAGYQAWLRARLEGLGGEVE